MKCIRFTDILFPFCVVYRNYRNTSCTQDRRKKSVRWLVSWWGAEQKPHSRPNIIKVLWCGILDVFGRFAYLNRTNTNIKSSLIKLNKVCFGSIEPSVNRTPVAPRNFIGILCKLNSAHWRFSTRLLARKPGKALPQIHILLAHILVSHAPSRSVYANGRISCGTGRRGEA